MPNDADLWDMFGSVDGLHKWLVRDQGCWISNLRSMFGNKRDSCGFCDHCKGMINQRVADMNLSFVNQETATLNAGMNVLRRIESQCVVCLNKFCDGEGCLPKKHNSEFVSPAPPIRHPSIFNMRFHHQPWHPTRCPSQ